MRRSALLLGIALATGVPLEAQQGDCPGDTADQRVTVTYPVAQVRDSLITRAESILAALGYIRDTVPEGKSVFRAVPRHDWPPGSEGAPWRRPGAAPGVQLAVTFKAHGKSTDLEVKAEALCALGTTQLSHRDDSMEHQATLFAAMQVIVAFSAGVDKALHAFTPQ